MREELYNAITARDATETTRLISAGIARTGTFTKIFASPHPVGIFEDLDGRNTIFHLLAQSGMIRDILPVLKSQLFSPKFLNREKLDMQLSTPANAERFLSQKMLQKNAKGVLPIHIAINTGNKGDVEYIVDNYGITFDDIMISSIFRDPEPMGWLLNYKIDLNTFKEIYKTFFGTIYCY
ncbi:MAG: hypothetical protein KA998_01775, partial [Rickettsiaceae bacterium]|nr:hypothetical protein [Rickettsiaceae bacterium]